jgi:murein DD-endopeptidase MepM/ murein hydrolase activator NlpD
MILGSMFAAAAGIGAAFLVAGQAFAGPGQTTTSCTVTVTVSDVCTTTATTSTTTTSTTGTTSTTTTGTTTTGTTATTTTETTTAQTTTTQRTTTTKKTAHRRHRARHPKRRRHLHAKPHRPGPAPPPPPAFIVPHVSPPLHAGPYVFPVYGPVSFADAFGNLRPDNVSWDHGTDIYAPLGAPVVAAAAGTVFQVGWNATGGNRLWLRDRAGDFFYYANMSAFSSLALSGARVSAGTVLGFVGNTGSARGMPYHLHFEVHPHALVKTGYDASAVDPYSYLRAWRRAEFRRLSSVAARFRIPAAAAQPVVRRVVKTAGAVLLQADDISRSSGLSPHSFRLTLRAPAPKVKPKAVAALTRVRPVFATGKAARAWARTAGVLDLGVTAPGQGATVWDRVAQCESGGNWAENSGNGFYGGVQFLESTWLAHGGAQFARRPDKATRVQQIIVARRTLADAGWKAWPACSLKLGLRH